MKNLFLTTAVVMTMGLPTLAYSMDYNTPSDNTMNNAPDNSMNNSNDMNNNYDDNNHSSTGSTTAGPPSKTSGSMNTMSGRRYVTRSQFLNQGHTRQEFKCIDKNSDGRLSRAELSAGDSCYNTGNQ
jgi:hypothetical protein